MKRMSVRMTIVVLAVIALMTGVVYASSYHAGAGGNITLYQSYTDAATNTPATVNSAYSPKATCARQCHLSSDGIDYRHEYGDTTGIANIDVPKNQSYIASDGSKVDVNYTVKAYAHGISVGRHMNEGRNEPYSADQRTTYGDPFFTSSPGMAGKY